jgi:uncharacterized protein (DUF2141 family)
VSRTSFYLCAALTLLASSFLTARGSAQDSKSAELFRDPVKQLVPLVSYSLNSTPRVVCVADFNGDGKLDLAVAGINSSSVTVTIALGLGNGKFTTEKDFTIPTNGYGPSGISAADLNHDGKIDLVVANRGLGTGTVGTVNVFLGNGDGTFSPGAPYKAGGEGVVIADFNGDGIPDIASPQESGDGVDLLLGTGDGTFTSGTSLSCVYCGVGGNPLAADLNHDGKLDLVLQLYGGGFYVALGNGDGTFQPTVFYKLPDAFTGEVIADFNQDEILDVGFAGDYYYCDFLNHTLIVGVALGNGDGTFQAPIVHNQTDVCGGTLALAADFNGDGKMDLLEAGTQELFLGKGTGVLEGGEFSGGLARWTSAGVVADFNGDGAPDLVVVDYVLNLIDVSLNVSGDRETLTSSANPSKQGHGVTFTAKVRATVNEKAVTGTVTFRDGKVTLGTVAVSGGIAAFPTNDLKEGTHSISAVYSGDPNYIPKTVKLVQIVDQ